VRPIAAKSIATAIVDRRTPVGWTFDEVVMARP